VVIVGAVWALMTWPWELKRRRQSGQTARGAALPTADIAPALPV